MKKIILISVCIFVGIKILSAQVQSPPPVEWKRDHHFPHYPIDSTGTLSFITDDDYSGEDWWYSIKNVYNASNVHVGYILCGFSHFEDYASGTASYPTPLLYDEVSGGLGGVVQGEAETACLPFYTDSPIHTYDSNKAGTGLQTIGYYRLNGVMKWCRTFNPGTFVDIVQSNDKLSFIAVGDTKAIKDKKYYQWTNPGDSFLVYNPTASDTNTFEGWASNGLASNQRQGNLNVVCIDTNGVQQWNYLYGNQDFALSGLKAWKNRGAGFGIETGPGTGSAQTFRVVGRTNIMNSSAVQTNQRSWYVLDIDHQGYVNWFDSPYSNYNRFSVAIDVKRKEGTNEYFVTGFKSNPTGNQQRNTEILLQGYSENSSSFLWDTIIDENIDTSSTGFITSGPRQANVGWSLGIDHDGNVLLGALINAIEISTTWVGNEANPRIFTIDADSNGFNGFARNPVPKVSTDYNLGTHDLRLALVSTQDSGFAFVSSIMPINSYATEASFLSDYPWAVIPGSCGWTANYQLKGAYWGADAMLVKYQLDTNSNWQEKWHSRIDSDNPRANYPGDLKKRECIFGMTEAQDGGLVFTGNSSDNHDDYYSVKVKDDCDNPLNITAYAISNCYGDSNAVAYANANGGTAPYTYSWPGSITGDTVSNLPSGSHIITVTDAAGCEAIAQLEIEEPDTVLYISSSTITNSLCANDSNGTITIVAAGGETPYVYHWSNGDTTNSIDSLFTGSYFLSITDSIGCEFIDTFNISSPSALVISPAISSDTVCMNDIVSLTSTPSGGTSPYTYNWSNSASSQNQSGITVTATTTYIITLTDDNGCLAVDSVSVYASPAPTITFTSVEVWAQAKDFPLLHAEPEGGSYSGSGVYSYLGDYWFKPSTCTLLSYCNQPITYTYTDSLGCSNSITDTFIVYHDCQGVSTSTMPPTISTTTGYGNIQYPLALASNNEAQITDLVHNQDYDLFFAGSYKGKTQIGHRIFKSVANSTDIVVGMFDGDNTGTNAGCGLVWLETYGGDGEDFGHAVEVENPLNNGYVYLAGEIAEGYDFDGNVLNVYTTTEKGFVIALDPTTYYTTWQWGSIVGANDLAVSSINDIALTPGGELGAVGYAEYFSNSLTFAGNTYSGGLLDDPFIGVYDAFGNEVRSAVIPDNDDGAYNAVENAGQDFIAVGNSKDLFGNTLTGVMPYGFGNLTYANTAVEHALFSRFAAPYTTLEVNLVGNAYDNSAEAIHADPNGGDYYVTGYYKEVIDFGCGPMASIMNGSSYTQDAFVLRMDANGNCLSQQTIGDLGDDECQAVYYSPSNWLFVGVGLDPGFGSEDEVLFELDPVSLNVNSGQVLINGAPSDNLITSLSTNIGWGTPVGAVIAGGYFEGTMSLNNTINAAGSNQDGFLARIAYNSSYFAAFKYDEKDTKVELNGLVLYPNPSTDILNIALEYGAKVSIYDAIGRLVYNAGLNEGITEINVSKWSRGIYHVISQHGSDVQSGKLVLQ